jgi:vacuolar-type H+-ATPase subunit H
MGQDPSEIREQIEQTRGEMGDTVEALGYKADVKTRAKDSVVEKRDRLRERITGSPVAEATPDAGDVKAGAKRAVGIAQENPLGLALGAAALGFLAGMVVPSTRIEDEKVGPIADDVKDRVKETGQEALERGKEVAQEAAQSAKETAQERGQEHAEELRESATEKADEVGNTARPAEAEAPRTPGAAPQVVVADPVPPQRRGT